MPVQAAHTWGERLREIAETVGAVLLILGITVRVGRVHVDRYVGGWFKRNKIVARAAVVELLGPELRTIARIPKALNANTRAIRANARATREHTQSMSSFSERIATVERTTDRLDERTKHITPEP